MKRTVFQHPELRDENDNIIQQGAFGKNTALANSTNDGWIDYVANDLEALYNNTMGGTGGEINTETITGKTGTITNLTATTVKAGTLTADALTVSGETSVPTANEGNSSKAIANTEYVQGELTNYLPLSGGTLTGVVNGVTPPNGDNSKKLATTEFVTATAQQADWNVTDTTSKAFIKNKPAVYGTSRTLEIEDTRNQIDTPSSFMANYNRRIKADFKHEDILGASTFSSCITIVPWDNSTGGYPSQLAFTSEGKLFYRIGMSDEKWGDWKRITLQGELTNYLPLSGGTLTGVVNGVTPTATDNSAKIATTAFVRTIVPAGVVLAYARGAVPTGWLLCDGSAVSRTDYAALFAVIGTTYGAGDGTNTFNLPNLIDKFVEGSATAGTVKSAGLPNITGRFKVAGCTGGIDYFDGAFYSYLGGLAYPVDHGGTAGNIAGFDASRSSSVYGNSTTVQPPSVTMRYIIKY